MPPSASTPRHVPAAHAALARARTLLFVPGHQPARFAKALASGADAVVLDLEDAVPAAQKAAAREHVGAALPQLAASATPVLLRINAVDSPAGQDDLAWLERLPKPAGVMIPKAEDEQQIDAVRARLPGCALLPLIESAAGLLALDRMARAQGVLRLVVGHIDFMADTGIRCSDDERELDGLRLAVTLHSRVNRLAPPVDGVTVAIDDAVRLQADVRRALNFGFGGKLCIHPKQLPLVHGAMAPSAQEIDWAQRVLAADAAAGGAAVQLDGRMVDAPVVLQARATLARAGSNG